MARFSRFSHVFQLVFTTVFTVFTSYSIHGGTRAKPGGRRVVISWNQLGLSVGNRRAFLLRACMMSARDPPRSPALAPPPAFNVDAQESSHEFSVDARSTLDSGGRGSGMGFGTGREREREREGAICSGLALRPPPLHFIRAMGVQSLLAIAPV